MTLSSDQTPRIFTLGRPSFGRIMALILLVAVLAFAWTCFRIMWVGSKNEAQSADAIVVFGAAEYSGRPSPVYRARLDHALELFKQGIAPVVITTGGSALDPRFSEGGVGRDYLMSHGIPERSLIAETQSANTAQSAKRVAVIMRANGMHKCVAVSDAFHMFRVKQMLQDENLIVFAAPRPGSPPRSAWQRSLAVAREAISYMLWRLHVT